MYVELELKSEGRLLVCVEDIVSLYEVKESDGMLVCICAPERYILKGTYDDIKDKIALAKAGIPQVVIDTQTITQLATRILNAIKEAK